MATIEEIRNQFSQKLEDEKTRRVLSFERDIQQLKDSLAGHRTKNSAEEVSGFVNRIKANVGKTRNSPPPIPIKPAALVNMTHSSSLKELDNSFLNLFHLPTYYSASKITYPTVLCETLDEFFRPFMMSLNYSEQVRQQELDRLITEAMEVAEKQHGGIFGVNFPGQGCYLNGWLFAKMADIQPGEIYQNSAVFTQVLATAAHEKLGHGFLSVYSTLGELKSSLGLSLVQIASEFGVAPSDDAAAVLRSQQAAILSVVSQFLEEGWATWIEHYLAERLFQNGTHPRHSYGDIVKAIQNLPNEIKDVGQLKRSFMQALGILLGEEEQPLEELLSAVKFLSNVGGQLDDFFAGMIQQPLRYALGELLCMQCEANLGELCVPYAALIAGNVTFDPSKISVTDLNGLFSNDPRLNPDARLAAISRIKLEETGNLNELTARVSSELSFSIPVEIRG